MGEEIMNQRIGKRASDECIKQWLEKYREQFHKMENDRRAALKKEAASWR